LARRDAVETRLQLAVLGGIALLALPTLALPLGRDQAIFALVGRIMAHGGFPYRDAFDFKPPGIHFLYALAAFVAPGSMWGPRALDLLALLVSSAALYRLVLPGGRAAAVIASAYLGIATSCCFRYWDLAQPETFSNALLLAAFLFWRDAHGRRGRLVAAGACFGGALLMKYTAALLLPLFALLAPPTSGRDVDVKARPRASWAAFGLGAAAVLAAALVYLAAGHALGPFVDIQARYLPGYGRLGLAGGWGSAVLQGFDVARDLFGSAPVLLVPPLVGLVCLTLWGRAPARWLPLAGILLVGAGVVVQVKFFYYHWIPLLPYLAWAAGAGAAALAARLQARRGWRRAAIAGFIAVGAVTLAQSRTTWRSERLPALRYAFGPATRKDFLLQPAFGIPGRGDYSVAATLQAAAAAQEFCPPAGRVFVWGFEPLLYLAAERTPTSRFIYTTPLLAPWSPAAWREEVVTALRADPPDLVVVVEQDALPWLTGHDLDSRAGLRLFPALQRLLDERYTAVGQLEHFTYHARIAAH
jgi:4-amino-4-deoxy-L-arabinose transferase-like glycosyltransferase